uniref:Uncharacterized protein n=1 Tax=Arundo donax TaxID=35708 RepID=A0A0A9G720_ARUDO
MIIHTNSRRSTILKCCSITTRSSCMVQPPLQDQPTNTWGTCPVARVRGLASRRCSNLHGHHSFSSQRRRLRVLFRRGLRFRLISGSSYPLMQSQGHLTKHQALNQLSQPLQLQLQAQTTRKLPGL